MQEFVNFTPFFDIKRLGFPHDYIVYYRGHLRLQTVLGINLSEDKEDYEILFSDGSKIRYIDDETYLFKVEDLIKFMQANFTFDIKRKG